MALAPVDLEGHEAGIVGLKQPPAIAVTLLTRPARGRHFRLLQDALYNRVYYRHAFRRIARAQVGDVQFTSSDGRGRIFVRRSLSWARTDRSEPVRPRFYPPKTKAGFRCISIAPELVATLRSWKVQCPQSHLDLVFSHVDGSPNVRDCVLMVGFYPAFGRADLRKVTFHSLRHSCASRLIAEGAPVTEVQFRLGHSSPAITLRVYSHWFQGTETGIADRLAQIMDPPETGESGQ